MSSSAPVDPRTGLPAFGTLPQVARVDDAATRVLAPNPSPMTLDGTNTYVLDAGVGTAAIIVDPGPSDPAHKRAVDGVVADRDLDVAGIVATHHHQDHAEAAAAWAASWGVEVIASTPAVAGPHGRVVADGDVLEAGGLRLEVIETPGHTVDSVSLRLPSGAVCTGDHILGRGTTVVAHPDGTLTQYLESLRTLLRLGPDALLPGHGPELTDDPSAVLEFHLAHRAHRLDQIRTAVAAGPRTVDELVAEIYAAHDRSVWPAAAASTTAAVEHLVEAGELRRSGDRVGPT